MMKPYSPYDDEEYAKAQDTSGEPSKGAMDQNAPDVGAPPKPQPYTPQNAQPNMDPQGVQKPTFTQLQEAGEARPPMPMAQAPATPQVQPYQGYYAQPAPAAPNVPSTFQGQNWSDIAANQTPDALKNIQGFAATYSPVADQVRALGYRGNNEGDIIDPMTGQKIGNMNDPGFDISKLGPSSRGAIQASPEDQTQGITAGFSAPAPAAFNPNSGPSALPQAVGRPDGLDQNAIDADPAGFAKWQAAKAAQEAGGVAPAPSIDTQPATPTPYGGDVAMLPAGSGITSTATNYPSATGTPVPGQGATSTQPASDNILQMLLGGANAPGAYGTDQVKNSYNWLGGQIDDQFNQQRQGLGEEMARRGLGASTIYGGRLNDLNIGQRSAKESLAYDLGDKQASQGNAAQQNKLAWLQSLMGYGQQGFNNDLATANFNRNQNNDYQDYILKLLGYGSGGANG